VKDEQCELNEIFTCWGGGNLNGNVGVSVDCWVHLSIDAFDDYSSIHLSISLKYSPIETVIQICSKHSNW
jgi:hypothetical protein